jgi:lysophospholipase L1-like esterase
MKEIKFLALGDSYTIGEGVDANERWPDQLCVLLAEKGIICSDLQIIAKTGWTTDELNAAIDEAKPDQDFDLVSLLIGVNNQYRGRSVEDYAAEFKALLARAIGFAGGNNKKVIVLSIPDWGVTPFAEGRDREKIAEEINMFNTVNKSVCDELGVKWFNITPLTRNAKSDLSLLAADGLHPSGKAYREWAEMVFEWVVRNGI